MKETVWESLNARNHLFAIFKQKRGKKTYWVEMANKREHLY